MPRRRPSAGAGRSRGRDQVEQRAKDTGDTRPFVLIEYSHAMGNSSGNFKKYWDV
ncbi:hypothetical protein DLE01_11950, partial [Streptomyces sp. FT05W]